MPSVSEGLGLAETQSMKLGSAADVSSPPGESKHGHSIALLCSPFSFAAPHSKHPTKAAAPQQLRFTCAWCHTMSPSCVQGHWFVQLM